jgi:hypothetical protein
MPRKKGGYFTESPPGALFRLKAVLNAFALSALLIAGLILAALFAVDLMVHP